MPDIPGPNDIYLGLTDQQLAAGHRLAAQSRHMILCIRPEDRPFDDAFFVPIPDEEALDLFSTCHHEPLDEDPEMTAEEERRKTWDHSKVGSTEEQLEEIMSTVGTAASMFADVMSGGFDWKQSKGITICTARNGAQLKMEDFGQRGLEALDLVHTPVETYAPRIYFKPPTSAESGCQLLGLEPFTLMVLTTTDKQTGTRPPPLSHKEQRLFVLECFVAASFVEDIPSMFLLFTMAKDAAFQYNRHGDFGDALDRFLAAIKTSMSYYSLAHDLAYYGVESGEAHDAASAYFAGSGRLKREYTRKAMLAYRNSAFESVREGGNVGATYPAHAWTCFGLSLKRNGEYQMAARAYKWGLNKCLDQDTTGKRQLFGNSISLWVAMQMTEAEVKAHDAANMAAQLQRCKDRTCKAKLVGLTCMASGCDKMSSGSEGSEGRLLRCSKCKKAAYCSQQCQKANWPEHKVECKLWCGQV